MPTVFDNYSLDVHVDGFNVELGLWDTAGQEDYDRLRPLSYPDAHVVLYFYAIDSPDSVDNLFEVSALFSASANLHNVLVVTETSIQKWISEVRHFLPGVPSILVGCKLDLRNNPHTVAQMAQWGQRPVSYQEVSISILPTQAYVAHFAEHEGSKRS